MDKLPRINYLCRVNTYMRLSQKRGRFEKAAATLFLRRENNNALVFSSSSSHRRRDISSSITRANDKQHHRNAIFSPNENASYATSTTPFEEKKTQQQRVLNYKNVLLVLKETALLKYTSFVGAAETNERYGDSYENVVRWDRLKARHETHEKAVLKGMRLLLFLSRVFLLFLFLLQH